MRRSFDVGTHSMTIELSSKNSDANTNWVNALKIDSIKINFYLWITMFVVITYIVVMVVPISNGEPCYFFRKTSPNRSALHLMQIFFEISPPTAHTFEGEFHPIWMLHRIFAKRPENYFFQNVLLT